MNDDLMSIVGLIAVGFAIFMWISMYVAGKR